MFNGSMVGFEMITEENCVVLDKLVQVGGWDDQLEIRLKSASVEV